MLKNRLVYLAVLLGTTLFFICFNGYLSLYVLLLALALPFVSLLISLPSILGTGLKLTTESGTARKGQKILLRLTAENRFPFAGGQISVTLTVSNTLTGEIQKERLSFFTGRKAAVSHRLTSAACGQVVCSLSKAWACDYMGLFSLPVRLGKKARCAVLFYPAVYRPLLFLDRVTVPDGEGDRYSQTKPGDDPSELFDLREYRTGDRLSRVHWKLSQKTGKTLVKEFGLPISDHILFLLDLNGAGGETDRLLDAFSSLSAFLLEQETACRTGFWNGDGGEFTLLEITDGETAQAALHSLLMAERRVRPASLREEQLPLGVSHVIYLCGRPDETVLNAVRAKMPAARLSLLTGAEQTGENEAVEAEDVIAIRPGSIAKDLNGFRL